jgi:hypothetical protein
MSNELEKLKAEMAEMKAQFASKGPTVLQTSAEAQEVARVAARKQRLADMREEAKAVAGKGATHVKYIVGPSGTVREGLGVVKSGEVISVPVTELPSNEWKVWKPGDFAAEAKSTSNSEAAEKAIAQRAALQSNRQ